LAKLLFQTLETVFPANREIYREFAVWGRRKPLDAGRLGPDYMDLGRMFPIHRNREFKTEEQGIPFG
jgi:hypothetical protein